MTHFNSETGRAAGQKSKRKAEDKTQKKCLRQIVEILLDTETTNSKGETRTNRELLVLAQFKKAVSESDLNSCKWLFGLTGEDVKPTPEIDLMADNETSITETITKIDKIHTWLNWQRYNTNICFLYGTTRSGKTFAVVQWLLIGLSTGVLMPSDKKAMILIAGQTLPFLRNGVAKYIQELAPMVSSDFAVLNNGLQVKHPNGEIRVQSFDDYSKTLSAQWTCVFFNEGNYISADVFDSLRIRTSGLIICDYNPSRNDWWGSRLQTKQNELFCTFRDNPYLSSSQLEAIDDIRVRGENAPYGSYENWFYHVYYLGEFAEMGGGVFTKVFKTTEKEFANCSAVLAHGIDFGDVSDPNAIVAVKIDTDQKKLFVWCKYYETATDDLRMVDILNAIGIQRLVCETATGGQTRMKNFKRLGFQGRVIPCEKEQVAQSVFNLTNYSIYCVDDISFNEFKAYKIENGKFVGADHCVDATRYVAHLLLTNKIR